MHCGEHVRLAARVGRETGRVSLRAERKGMAMGDDTKQRVLDKAYSLTRAEQKQWEAPPPDAEKPVDPNTPKCFVCGRALMASHREGRCMRAEILRLRAVVAEREAEISTLKNVSRLDRSGLPLVPRTEKT